MVTHIQLSQIINNLMLSSASDMVHINKTTLANIQVHIQHAHETIEFLQLESQLQINELQEKHVASKSLTNPEKADHSTSFIQPASSVEVVPVQLSSKPIIKPWEEIQSNRNRSGLGYVKYNDNLHIPNYSTPIQFVSARVCEQITSASSQQLVDRCQCTQTEVADKQKCTQTQVEDKLKCSHCQRTSHLENQCFDLHPCSHCGKSNHTSEKRYNQ